MKLLLIVFSAVIYLFCLVGVYLLTEDLLRQLVGKIKMRQRLRVRRQAMQPEKPVLAHFRRLLEVTFHAKINPVLLELFLISLFVVTLLVSIQQFSILPAILVSGLLTAMPYVLLRIRLESLRGRSSMEAESLITLLVTQYRIHSYNLFEAMEAVISQSDEIKQTGRLLFRLLLSIRSSGDPTVIKRATDDFAYVIHTNWSRMLANHIRMSTVSGSNISNALEDILIQLRDARSLLEERKRLNAEAVRMTLFLVPVLYIATVLLCIRYMKLSFPEFIANQFFSQEGLLLFLSGLFLFFLNIALMELVLNQRFDC